MSKDRKEQILGTIVIVAILAYFFIPSFHNLVVTGFTLFCVAGVFSLFTGGSKKSRGGNNRKKSGPTWVERSINPNYMREESDAEAERQRRIRDRRQDERQRQWDEDWAKKRAADRLWDEQHH